MLLPATERRGGDGSLERGPTRHAGTERYPPTRAVQRCVASTGSVKKGTVESRSPKADKSKEVLKRSAPTLLLYCSTQNGTSFGCTAHQSGTGVFCPRTNAVVRRYGIVVQAGCTVLVLMAGSWYRQGSKKAPPVLLPSPTAPLEKKVGSVDNRVDALST
eukprot:1861057-Rhodomonas_salina.2